jgi:hypothetical protein
LKDKKRGNSDYKDRIQLLKKYIATFGKQTIECVLGDREFIGKNWVEWLDHQQIPYVLRIKENGQYIGKKNGKMVKAASLFKSLPVDKAKYLGKRKIGKTDTYLSHMSILKATNHQKVALIHSSHIKEPFQLYRRRWEIELLFKIMKTSGFDLEATHITLASRLETLLAIVAISCCFAYRVGIYDIQEKPPKLKKHGYKPFNTVRFGLDLLIDMIRGKFVDRATTFYKKKKPLLLKISQYLGRIEIFVV